MNMKIQAMLFTMLLAAGHQALADETFYATNYLLSAPVAGQPGSTAIHMSSNSMVAWADGYSDVQYGTDVAEEWKTPGRALGAAQGISEDVVSLGRGGQITLSFTNGIADRAGADFAIFENGFDEFFLELAYVEVSSDGTNFVRFPNYSDTPTNVAAFGWVYTEYLYGLASKYQLGYGTPFDLNDLQVAYQAQLAGMTDFSDDFALQLTNTFPHLDLSQITHIRLIDIIGDGLSLDARGQIIYDPYATVGSAGFDLDAIGVIHHGGVLTNQHIFIEPLPNQLIGSAVSVHAVASSGLPVSLEVMSGPASISGTILTMTNGTGTIELRAMQPGDVAFAPAADIILEFECVNPGASNAPLTLAQWAALHAVPVSGTEDSDSDTAIDIQEFIMGGDPNMALDMPKPTIDIELAAPQDSFVLFEYSISRKARGRSRIIKSINLISWTDTVPEIIGLMSDTEYVYMTVRLPIDREQQYYRLIFEAL
jgi:hypothetical protein